jgi:hypothetical protein
MHFFFLITFAIVYASRIVSSAPCCVQVADGGYYQNTKCSQLDYMGKIFGWCRTPNNEWCPNSYHPMHQCPGSPAEFYNGVCSCSENSHCAGYVCDASWNLGCRMCYVQCDSDLYCDVGAGYHCDCPSQTCTNTITSPVTCVVAPVNATESSSSSTGGLNYTSSGG